MLSDDPDARERVALGLLLEDRRRDRGWKRTDEVREKGKRVMYQPGRAARDVGLGSHRTGHIECYCYRAFLSARASRGPLGCWTVGMLD